MGFFNDVKAFFKKKFSTKNNKITLNAENPPRQQHDSTLESHAPKAIDVPPKPEISPEDKLLAKHASIAKGIESQMHAMETLDSLDGLACNGKVPDFGKLNDKALSDLYKNAMLDQNLNSLPDDHPDSIINVYERMQNGQQPSRREMQASLTALTLAHDFSINQETIDGIKTFKSQNLKISIEGAVDVAKFDMMNLQEKGMDNTRLPEISASMDNIKQLKGQATEIANRFDPEAKPKVSQQDATTAKDIGKALSGVKLESVVTPIKVNGRDEPSNSQSTAPRIAVGQNKPDMGLGD